MTEKRFLKKDQWTDGSRKARGNKSGRTGIAMTNCHRLQTNRIQYTGGRCDMEILIFTGPRVTGKTENKERYTWDCSRRKSKR